MSNAFDYLAIVLFRTSSSESTRPSAILVDCNWRWKLLLVQDVNEEFVWTNDDMNNEEIGAKAKPVRSRKVAGGLTLCLIRLTGYSLPV